MFKLYVFLPILFLGSLLAGCSNMAASDMAVASVSGVHEFGSTALTFSPNGKFLVSGGHQGDVKLWNVQTHKVLLDAKPHTGAVRAIAITGSGMFATASDDGRIFLWNNGKTLTQETGTLVTSLIWFQGQLVSGHDDKVLRVWDKTLKQVAKINLDDAVGGLAVHTNTLAVAMDNQILLLDAQLKASKVLDTDGTFPHDIQFSPDGKKLAGGGWFRLHVWDVASGQHRSIPTEHGGLLTSVSFSPDSKHIVTLGRHTDSAIRVMETQSFAVERRYQAHKLCGAMIRYSPDGRWMASASDDESVRFYDMAQEYQPGKNYDAPFDGSP